MLHRDWWGRGLATEGGRAGLECWREHLDDPQLIAITTLANRRSRAVMERLGLTPRGATNWHVAISLGDSVAPFADTGIPHENAAAITGREPKRRPREQTS